MRGSSSRRLRGVVLTTELVLLIIAVIVFAVIAFFGLSKTLISQATSQKTTLMPVRAEAWRLQNGVAGTIYVQNVGSHTVDITTIGMFVASSYGYTIGSCSNSTLNVRINPGEYKALSIVCRTTMQPSYATSVYIYVRTSDNNEVGMAASVQSP